MLWRIQSVTDTSSETIVEHTKSHFTHYGIPVKVITDNGPQFRAQVYEEFAVKWGFNHVTSSPYHSQSNGKAEVTVKIAKTCWEKWLKITRTWTLQYSLGTTPLQKEWIIVQYKSCSPVDHIHNYRLPVICYTQWNGWGNPKKKTEGQITIQQNSKRARIIDSRTSCSNSTS